MDECKDAFPVSSNKEVSKILLSIPPITPLAFLLCKIPARIADFAKFVTWYQGENDPPKSP